VNESIRIDCGHYSDVVVRRAAEEDQVARLKVCYA
jgi:hypothetical protein